MTPFDRLTLDEFERQVVDPQVAALAVLDVEIGLVELLIAHMERCPHPTAGDALDCMEAKSA